ncbi:geranylgeranyl reductase family protein [Luteipulveratus sp. YIM 133132]|uniref:geranylgeranyl reductase family protein n=1 Tax=Luteipulveratus flavus TaxID=3031728 RepID=UPI0023AFA719|nr:geranylgeranyl reductase family protein [Luteipulveratus sp. YIM 133132]MDE9366853.1 geranylgeranyl reductase family protein [Luteipulveratus sp. YIM 133132]
MLQRDDEIHDVAVVGAGPAGSSAARAAALAGARTLILDRARFPRYKTCGGGLIGATLAHLPDDLDLPVQQRIDRVVLSCRGRRETTRSADRPVLTLVNRSELDERLLASAARAGAEVRQGVAVTAVTERDDHVELTTADGPVRARWVVGADGSTSRIGRYVGVQLAQTDLGLEVELDPGEQAERWKGRLALDFGGERGAYAWVFPKDGALTVGVIMAKGAPEQTRRYLAEFIAQHGLDGLAELRSSGHLTRCRTPDSPLGRGRVLVAGDAAGLLEPWTREGISYAVRSGLLAGAAAASGTTAPSGGSAPEAVLAAYTRDIGAVLAREMAAGAALLATFERWPGLMVRVLTTGPWGWRAFRAITTGDATLERLVRRRTARVGLAALGRIVS